MDRKETEGFFVNRTCDDWTPKSIDGDGDPNSIPTLCLYDNFSSSDLLCAKADNET